MFEGVPQKRLLLPFTNLTCLAQTLEPALDAAEAMSAELLVLRVCPTAEASDYLPDEETLYTELRGIQARLQGHPIATQIDTIAGPPARSIVAYAGQHQVDLIMLSESGDVKDGKPLAERVANRASCETVVFS